MTQDNLHPEGHERWTVADMNNENAKFHDFRGDAEDALERANNAPGVDAELFPPGESPAWMLEGDNE